METFNIKTATWANNERIPPHPKAKLLNRIWKLKMLPKIKLFAWKLIRAKIPTIGYLKDIGLDIDTECPFCNDDNEDIDHLFKNCRLTQQIWNNISEYCPNPKDSNMNFIDWIEFMYNQEKKFDNRFQRPLEKIAVIAW